MNAGGGCNFGSQQPSFICTTGKPRSMQPNNLIRCQSTERLPFMPRPTSNMLSSIQSNTCPIIPTPGASQLQTRNTHRCMMSPVAVLRGQSPRQQQTVITMLSPYTVATGDPCSLSHCLNKSATHDPHPITQDHQEIIQGQRSVITSPIFNSTTRNLALEQVTNGKFNNTNGSTNAVSHVSVSDGWLVPISENSPRRRMASSAGCEPSMQHVQTCVTTGEDSNASIDMSSDNSISSVSCSFSSPSASGYIDHCHNAYSSRYPVLSGLSRTVGWKRWSCEGLTKLCSPINKDVSAEFDQKALGISATRELNHNEKDSSAESWDYMALRNVLTNGNFVLAKGDRLVVLRLSKDKKWAEVKKRDNSTGWIQFNSIKPVEDIKTFVWYHQNATRVDAEMKLRSGINGSFLVRDSESIKGQLSLSLRCDERVYHYRINRDDRNQYYVNGERRFPTLAELIANHSQKADGLVCELKSPLRSEVMDVHRMRTTYVEDRPDLLSSLRTSANRGSRAKPHEIKRRELMMKHKLGGGQYGDVYEAFWKERQLKVAVKTLRADGHMGIDDFLSEAALMQLMEHPNLVKLYGVCSNEAPYFIVSEYMSKGNLTDYLKQEKPALPILIQMILQVSSAMAYLEHHHFIHRDLAARNCLVGDDHIVKVADFGLARILREDHYDAKSGSKFPIKWTAPEGLAYSRFSNKSDVWSFGVLLWEIMSYGAVPFVGINLSDVYQLLSRGYRMTVPVTCPKAVAKLMKKCWEWYPEDRPTFEMLMDEFDKMFNVHTTRAKDMVSGNSSGQKMPKSGKIKQKARYYQTDDVFSMDKHELFKMDASQGGNDKKVGSSKTSPRKLRSFMRSESCNPSTHSSNRTVRNDSSRASRNPAESRRSLKSQVLEPLAKVKPGQSVKPKNEHLEHHDINYVKGSDDGSVSSGPSSKETNRQILSHMQSKHDLRSADESGYYEDDFKFSGTSLHEMIRNLEQLRRKIVDSAGLLPSERKSLMCIVEESQRNIHTYLDNIESAPLRFRLRESLDMLNELVPKILGNRRCMYSNYSKKSALNDTHNGQTVSSTGDGQIEHFMRVLDSRRDDIVEGQDLDKGSCLDWMVSKDSSNDVEQMDRILQFLIEIFSTTSIRQAEDGVTTQIDTDRLNDLNQ